MDVEALKEFRAKLVKARSAALDRKFDQWVTHACREGDLTLGNSEVDWNGVTPQPLDLWNWYWNASPSERMHMWDKSIKNLDAQISLGRENNT